MIIVKCDEDVYTFEDNICEAELEEELAQLKEFYKKVEVVDNAAKKLD